MFIIFVIIIKLCFIILALTHAYLKAKKRENTELNKKVVFWKDRLEFIFILSMSLLLIYIFNPRYDRHNFIDYETKLLFYLFGFVLIITAKWDIFIRK